MEDHSAEAAKCFVPAMLVDFIERNYEGGKEGLEPCSYFIHGVCLLADISGFTKLSGEYCSLGREGIDGLQLATNGYMGQLVEIIYSCGGEIIKFAGDAIICVFATNFSTGVAVPEKGGPLSRAFSTLGDLGLDMSMKSLRSRSGSPRPGPLLSNLSAIQLGGETVSTDAVLRAMHCAQILKEIQTDKLTVHVAMSCGEMCFGILGGVDNRWECLISGPCIHELSHCLDDAPSKTAVMTKACADIVLQVAITSQPRISKASTIPEAETESSTPLAAAASNRFAYDTDKTFAPIASTTVSASFIDTSLISTDTIESKVLTEAGHYLLELAPLPSGNFRIARVELVEPEHAIRRHLSHSPPTVGTGAMVAAMRQRSQMAFYTGGGGVCDFGKARTQAKRLIRQFVPVPIAEDIEIGRGLNFIAEIREVTTMFMKWDSYDADSRHRDLMTLQAAFFSAQEVLHSTGAYLRQFLVDDKGCVLIACWGMPHLSYLDNAHRALSAAAQIRRKLLPLEMSCSFGITTGDVYCGTVGSALRMEYAAIGSVVNMAARLMGKADGGILVDDATHRRLPSAVASTMQALPPMKVKGRDEPLQVYSYVSAETVHVREKVPEDHEIPGLCRDALILLVDTMTKTAAAVTAAAQAVASTAPTPVTSPKVVDLPKKRSRHASLANVARLLSASASAMITPSASDALLGDHGHSHSSSHINAAVERFGVSLRMVLMKGKEGSGRTTVIKWLRKQAQDRRIATYSVRASAKDAHTDYAIWTRLFHLLAPKGMFLSVDSQRKYVHSLLERIYPHEPHLAASTGFPVLKAYLGFTCTYHPVKQESRSAVHWLSNKFSPGSAKPAASAAQTQDVMYRVFAHLLNVQTSLFILENVELCDECSLKLLVSLQRVVTTSAVVLTALDESGAAEEAGAGGGVGAGAGGGRSFFHTRAAYRQEAFKSTVWSREYEEQLTRGKGSGKTDAATAEDSVTVLTLANYTPSEIDSMLCVALEVTTVPPEVSQLVQDFSGGSYFWVREILQFIKEHGAEQFLSAIGEKESTNNLNVYASVEDMHSRGGRLKHLPSSANLMASGGGGGLNTSPQHLKRSSSTRQLTKAASFRVPTANRVAESPHQLQLNKLVLCRFGNLPSDVQRVLRTASIIGFTFTSSVLQGVVAPQLREQLSDCFQNLLNQRWLYQDVDHSDVYQFAHMHAHQLIYELTPSSERASIHRQIADHMEKVLLESSRQQQQPQQSQSAEDKLQYGLMSFHYQQCGCEPTKALAYAAQATDGLLQQITSIYDFGDCLDLLTGCVACCMTTQDVAGILTLVNRTRVAIREYDIGSRKYTLVERCVGYVTGACGAALRALLRTSGARVSPEDGASTKRSVNAGRGTIYTVGLSLSAHQTASMFGRDKKSSDGLPELSTSLHSTSLHSTSLHSVGANSGKLNRTASTASAAEELSDEKRAKRMFLQQINRLFDELSEKMVDVAADNELVRVMKEV